MTAFTLTTLSVTTKNAILSAMTLDVVAVTLPNIMQGVVILSVVAPIELQSNKTVAIAIAAFFDVNMAV
jgi:hypothetical protein